MNLAPLTVWKIKTPITYYGGKQRMASTILKLIPEHKLYCEPFFGGWAVFFAKNPSQIEVINDINGHVVNFFSTLKKDFPILRMLIQATPHSRQMHRQAEFVLKYPDHFNPITHARAFRTQTTMWFGSSLFTGYSFERWSHRTYQKTSNKRLKFWKHLPTGLSFQLRPKMP
jgi:DNA adenine methylase